MQDVVPPAGTAFREVTRSFEESEGRVAQEFAASLLPLRGALAAPKVPTEVVLFRSRYNSKTDNRLACIRGWAKESVQ
jgi:hypothetical protein